jgi:small-conductance mechanosensitive channel
LKERLKNKDKNMSKDIKVVDKLDVSQKRQIIATFSGAVITILLILATLEISRRDINTFITSQQKYILAIEAAVLAIFIVEMLARLVRLLPAPQMVEEGTRLRLIVRIVGYFMALMSIVSVLASNPALGISVGAIAAVIIAFATQNIVGSVLAAVLLLSTRMVRVGEEITISQTKGIVADINLTHTVISVDEDVVFIPNSLLISSMVRRKKRNSSKDADVHNW